jgi:hypothetical protein
MKYILIFCNYEKEQPKLHDDKKTKEIAMIKIFALISLFVFLFVSFESAIYFNPDSAICLSS